MINELLSYTFGENIRNGYRLFEFRKSLFGLCKAYPWPQTYL
jgi:hypothetical protein